ncbi:MAG: alanine--tRNA ligase [candidate division WOR-3 bacterium]|nr:MAG: alanine--tRNA ligase [candidate division WOR-3 bacterium]
MKSAELRKSFLDFFKERDHTIVPSMSLIPRDDPSLLFTSAGMVQFKPLWTGTTALPYRRATSVQKCLRTTDLDNVGRTRRHLTFFEMLGNFSFGDYFKEDAIVWAWEYLTEVLAINKSKLSVSVYTDDDEAYDIWHKKIGLGKDLIVRLGDDHNFWGPAGNSGPCGPCSEIFYDLGKEFSCGKKSCAPGCDCDRFPEIWNLVFPQFNQTVSGERQPLQNRGVDTGMGFERLASVLQRKDSNFQTDLFAPIIDEIAEHTKIKHGGDPETDIAVNVLADHIRALVFAIGDGIIPSNEERGYVLRRLLRRGVRLCRNLKIKDSFLYKLVPRVVQIYGPVYHELADRREEITLVIKSEEERFLSTLEKGLIQLEELFNKQQTISGEDAFRLYDTYGFPVELTQEIAKERTIKVDEQGFMRMLGEAREISKAKAKFIPKGEWKVLKDGVGSFVGYESTDIETTVLRYNVHDHTVELVLAESPFYAEAGGQVGEQGQIEGPSFKLKVIDTYWYQGMIVCHCKLTSGKLTSGSVRAIVDLSKRKESARAHTATHLLHAALRETLGEHARQEGSFVEPGRFRFDFTHFKPLSDDEVNAIEDTVNEKILSAMPVEKFFTSLDEAKKMGAMAIFGEKYGERVRVVRIGDFSIELCGGIHLENTGEIGLFKIVGQESAAAGIRRVEAIVGLHSFEEFRKSYAQIQELNGIFGTDKDLLQKVHDFQSRMHELEKANQDNCLRIARVEAAEMLARMKKERSHFISQQFADYSSDAMRAIADILRETEKGAIGILYQESRGKINYLLFVGPELIDKHPADKLVKDISRIFGGGGGGRPHLAEGGGGDPKKIQKVLTFLKELASAG